MTQHMCCKRRLVRTEVHVLTQQCVSSLLPEENPSCQDKPLLLARGKPLSCQDNRLLLARGKTSSLARGQRSLARTILSCLLEAKPLFSCLGANLNLFPASRQKLPLAMQAEDISSQFPNLLTAVLGTHYYWTEQTD